MFTFMRNFVGVKTDQAQAGVEALVRWDPGATEAELRSMEQHLDELGPGGRRGRSTTGERQEATTIKALLNQRMAAAEQLENQRTIEFNAERKASLRRAWELWWIWSSR